MRSVARIISRVFDPVFEIPLILLGLVSMAYLNGYRWRFFLLMLFLDAILPGIVFIRMLYRKHGRDWDITKREERLPLFIATIIFHGMGVGVAYLINRHPLAEILLGLWILAIIFTTITFFWKISLHSGVNSTMATLVYLLVSREYWWVFIIPAIVSIARVIDKRHTIGQVIAGGLLPPLYLFLWLSLLT